MALAIVSDGVTDKMSPYLIASTVQRSLSSRKGDQGPGPNAATVPRSPGTLQCAGAPLAALQRGIACGALFYCLGVYLD